MMHKLGKFFLLLLIMLSISSAYVEKWKYRSEESRVGPIVDDKNVYIFTGTGKIYAIDRITGSRRWIKELGEPITVQPSHKDGMLYVPTNTTLFVVDSVGRDIAKVKVRATAQPQLLDYVYVADGSTLRIYDYSLLFLRAIPLAGYTDSASTADAVYAITSHAVLQRCTATDCRIIANLSFLNRSVWRSNPLITEGAIYFAAEDFAVAVDRGGGIKWTTKLHGILSSPKSDGGLIYFGSTDGNVYALQDDGNVSWVVQLGDATSSLHATSHTVYVGSKNNKVTALSTAAVQRWSANIDDWPIDLSLKEGILYALSLNGTLYALSTLTCNIESPEDGDIIWHPTDFAGTAVADAGVARTELRTIPGDWLSAVGKERWTFGRFRIIGFTDGEGVGVQCRAIDNEGNVEIVPPTNRYTFYASPERAPRIEVIAPATAYVGEEFTMTFASRGVPVNATLRIVLKKDGKVLADETVTVSGKFAYTPNSEGDLDISVYSKGFARERLTIPVTLSPFAILVRYGVLALAVICLAAIIWWASRLR